jgi:hypothetical protein
VKATPRFPATYVNTAVERAIDALHEAPSERTLHGLLSAAQKGGLVLDVTGSTPETGTQVRTIVSTEGQLVLPLFTSMAQLKLAVGQSAVGAGTAVQAAVVSARQALELVTGDGLIAVQFNPGGTSQVVARAHVEAALGTSRTEASGSIREAPLDRGTDD